MVPSIRTFLLINLLLSVTLITSLAIVGNLFLAHKDIQRELDSQLISTANRIKAIMDIYPDSSSLKSLQKRLNKTEYEADSINEFQVWNKGVLILKSKGAPATPLSLSSHEGTSNSNISNTRWRVNLSTMADSQNVIMVADRYNYRQHLENQFTKDSIIIMLVTYPFLGLLIWIIVGRGLNSLATVTEELKHREPSFLEPVNMNSVPSEIAPLVKGLNDLFFRLKEAFNRHERFTSDAAHELKTPLAALSAQTQFALRTETPDARNDALLKVLGGVNRCTHVVQQLLTFSRMCPEAGINDPSEVNLTKHASDIAAMLAPEAIAKDIELELISDSDTITTIGNSTALSILIRNLVDNAIRYSNEGGFVKIHVEEKTKKFATLRVIDSGPGIPEELKQRVFERFFRVIGNKTTGSGLGLGIVQQIVKLHKANIQLITPESGIGLEVRIEFTDDPLKC